MTISYDNLLSSDLSQITNTGSYTLTIVLHQVWKKTDVLRLQYDVLNHFFNLKFPFYFTYNEKLHTQISGLTTQTNGCRKIYHLRSSVTQWRTSDVKFTESQDLLDISHVSQNQEYKSKTNVSTLRPDKRFLEVVIH